MVALGDIKHIPKAAAINTLQIPDQIKRHVISLAQDFEFLVTASAAVKDKARLLDMGGKRYPATGVSWKTLA